METTGVPMSPSKIQLQDGWQAKLSQDGRLYYLDHNSKTSHWIPPPTSWSDQADLPYGWEGAMDKNGKPYYINHVTCTTTREDPFEIEDIPPVERDVVLTRDSVLGFGFIAGSEKPVVIRSVTEGGPSVGKLLPGDKILKINGEDVSKKEGQFIIERIRQSQELIRLTVIQPYIDKTGLKSSFLSAIKKQKLKAKPSRVRFSETESIATISPQNTKVPPSLVYLPNVLKVYLENGQTKSFKFDNKTTVKDVLHNLQEKLGIKCMEYFSLGVHDIRNPSNQQLTILQDDEHVRQTASRPGSQHLKCLLHVTFVPKDAYDLLSRDPVAFDYFYLQCCNDVTSGRFGDEIKFDMAVKLAALQIQQHVLCNKQKAKVSIKAVQKDDGLERFLPKSITDKHKSKELRKIIGQHIKQNQNLTAPGKKHLTELQAKLHYLKVISELESFGGKFYHGTLLGESEGNFGTQMTVLVGPKCSVSQVIEHNGTSTSLSTLVNLCELSRLKLSRKGPICDDVYRLEMIRKENQSLVFLLHTEDAQDMASLINGYYRLFEDPNHSLLPDDETRSFLMNTEAPSYRGKHKVLASGWNYPGDVVTEIVDQSVRRMQEGEHIVDLATGPPSYVYDAAFISRMKREKRFHSKENLNQTDGAQSFESESDTESDSETTPNRNANNFFLSASSDDSQPRKGSMVDLNTLTDLVDSMFNTAPERIEDNNNAKSLKEIKKLRAERKRFSFSDAVRPKRKLKYGMSGSASTDDIDGSIKLVNYSGYHDDMQRNDSTQDSDLSESDGDGDFILDSVPRRKKNVNDSKAALISRDSIYLIRTKVNYSGRYSPTPETYSSDDDYNLTTSPGGMRDTSCNSPLKDESRLSMGAESDIIDLTLHPNDASVVDIDISIGDDLNEIDVGMLDDKLDHIPEERLQDQSASATKTDDTLETSTQDEDEEDLPVSMIDLPSPDSEDSQELSDHAHGIQMAAIDALSASIVVDDVAGAASNDAARPAIEPECASDSGNETIASETIENPTDQVGFSHSPTDYFRIMGTEKPSSSSPRRASDVGESSSNSTPDSYTLASSLPDDSAELPNLSANNSAIEDSNDNQADLSFDSVRNNTLTRLFQDDSPDGKMTAHIDSVQNNSVTCAVDEHWDESTIVGEDEEHVNIDDEYANEGDESTIVENDEHDEPVNGDDEYANKGDEHVNEDDEYANEGDEHANDNERITDQDLDALFALNTTQDTMTCMTEDELTDNEDADLNQEETEDQNNNVAETNEIAEDETSNDVEMKATGEDLRQSPTGLSVTLGSDTDSYTSTLRGSVANLTLLESTEELCESMDNTLEDEDDDGEEEEDTNDAIDELIASLITAPPPSISAAVDEELLSIIIPPPPVDDFDFGTIDDVVQTPNEDLSDGTIPVDKDNVQDEVLTSEEKTDCLINDQNIPGVESESVAVSTDAEESDPNSPLTKYINSLKSLKKDNDGSSQQIDSNHLDIKQEAVVGSSPRPRKFRPPAGSVGESLDSGFHQSDSVDLDSLSSCFSSLQEGQFVKEKTAVNEEDKDTEKQESCELKQDQSNDTIMDENATKDDMDVCTSKTDAIVDAAVVSNVNQNKPEVTAQSELLDSKEIDASMSTVVTKDVDETSPSDETEVKGDDVIRTELEQSESNDVGASESISTNRSDAESNKIETKSDNGGKSQEHEAVQMLDKLTVSLDNVSIASTVSSSSFHSNQSSESKSSTKDDVKIDGQTQHKATKPKPTVPPKPIRPFVSNRRQSLDSNLLLEKRTGNDKKYPAPAPPVRNGSNLSSSVDKPEMEISATNLQRSESMQVFSANDCDDSARPAMRSAVSVSSGRHPLMRSKAIDNGQSSTEDLQTDDDSNGNERSRSPVKRSNTISVSSPEREPGRLYPARKAPPPPMPKPKLKNIKMGVSNTWSARGSTLPAQSDPSAIRRMLSPTRSKPWTRSPLPFARKDKDEDKDPEPEVKSPKKKVSLPHKMFYTWTKKEANKAKHSLGRGDSPRDKRGKVDPPSLREVMGMKRPSVLDLAERMQQASDDASKNVNRSTSLRSPRTLPRTSVVYTPRHSVQLTSPTAVNHASQSPRNSVQLTSPPAMNHPTQHHKHSVQLTSPPAVISRTNSEDNSSQSPRPGLSPRPRPVSMPCSPSHVPMELPKRPPPPRPRAPPRGSISSVSDMSDSGTPPTPRADQRVLHRTNSFGSVCSESSYFESPPHTPPTPRADQPLQRTNSFSESESSDSSGTRTPPTPRAERRFLGASSPAVSPEEDQDWSEALSPVPLPSPVPTEDMDSSINSELTSPPPLPNSAPPPLPSSLPPSVPPANQIESPTEETNSLHSQEQRLSPNLTLEIESKDYRGDECIVDAVTDIETMVNELQNSMDKLKPSTPSIAQFRQCKQMVQSEAREFTSNTKMFVSSAGQSAEQLVRCLNSSMHTLARLCTATQQFIKAIPSVNQAKNLGNKINEITYNFSITLQVAAEAHGKVLQDPKMQQLLRQAQTMAIMLSALMRTLRILHC